MRGWDEFEMIEAAFERQFVALSDADEVLSDLLAADPVVTDEEFTAFEAGFLPDAEDLAMEDLGLLGLA